MSLESARRDLQDSSENISECCNFSRCLHRVCKFRSTWNIKSEQTLTFAKFRAMKQLFEGFCENSAIPISLNVMNFDASNIMVAMIIVFLK